MVHCLGVKVLDALVPDLGHVCRVKQITKTSSFRSTKVSSVTFPRFTSHNQTASLTLISRENSLERISAECRDTVRLFTSLTPSSLSFRSKESKMRFQKIGLATEPCTKPLEVSFPDSSPPAYRTITLRSRW
ncbi:hypothetical protein EVAR_76666_1 [Eumeta japonica]|uniref:Uncharacterized protein n=1 Tax=Eumeta variegata TaxID=151549 RepID=A0A4C1YC83_EUMVA|nr:hypothetical protein EVAR_76666_1 [Eumeta japonica]